MQHTKVGALCNDVVLLFIVSSICPSVACFFLMQFKIRLRFDERGLLVSSPTLV